MIPVKLAKILGDLEVTTSEGLIALADWSAGELAERLGWKTTEVETAIKDLSDSIKTGKFRNQRAM